MSEKVFKYRAMDAQGKEYIGEIEALNENDANSKLKNQGLFPFSINKPDNIKKEKVRDEKKSISLEEKIELINTVLPQEEKKKRRIIFQIRLFGLIFTLEFA